LMDCGMSEGTACWSVNNRVGKPIC